jgi:hypothetical protein
VHPSHSGYPLHRVTDLCPPHTLVTLGTPEAKPA